MRCEHCFSEWQSPKAAQEIFCPLCHSPLVNIQEKFNSLEEVLLYLTRNYGIETLQNKQDTLQFIDYYLPDGKREYNFTNMIYAANLMETLFRLCNSPESMQRCATKQVVIQLCDKYGTSAEWADYVVGCICKCLGMVNCVDHSIIKIKKAAEQNNAAFQLELAERYYDGRDVERDLKKYLKWLERSAKNGYPAAKFLLGQELWNGANCEKNEAEAVRFLEEAIKSGNRDAICLIAASDEMQERCSIDIEKLVKSLIELKDELSVKQLLNLSWYYSNHNNVVMAITLVKSAYEKDEKMAWESYVRILRLDNTHENKILALKVLRDTATNGNAVACKMLGRQYENKASSESDMMTALYWYRRAAEIGDVDTQIHLAKIYEQGIGIQKNIEKAIYWYRIAAFNGSALAKSKVSYKSEDCIVQDLTLIFEDDSEQVCLVRKSITYQGKDYLVISDLEMQEKIVVRYIENSTADGFEIEETDESIENAVLQIYGGDSK